VRGEGRALAIWGYTHTSAAELIAHAHAFADPSLLGVIDNPEAVASKRMPTFKAGQQLGFLLRVCPIVRLAKSINGHREGAEVDAFLARCFGEHSDTPVSREAVYQEWLLARLNQSDKTGVTVTSARMAAFSRERVLRRTHGRARQAKCLERPDVRFEGNLIVDDGARFNDHLAHGVGRHRAFGFGALILVPPGTSHRP
jgi:CRISPR system Cascade subunit CasE